MTLYHLEPNLKEAPGGLRDCNVANWLALISAMDKLHDWPEASSLRPPIRKQLESALDFLMSARCFLHFRHGRDDNTLSWEAQDEAAARKIGAPDAEELSRPIGCESISVTPAPCSVPSRNCWKRFLKPGRRSIGRCRAGAPGLLRQISPSSTGSSSCNSHRPCRIPKCCCACFTSWRTTD